MSVFRPPPLAAALLGLALNTPCPAQPVQADERILSFHAAVDIHADGNLLVTETIRVRAAQDRIRQGIYRDFPTDYRDRFGNRYRAAFDVLQVRRNGEPEPYHRALRSNGQRVYIGKQGRILAQGIHEYRLQYRTTRQIGFFDTYDELYWNVTGTGWAFPIDRAAASVRLPRPAPLQDLHVAYYTGGQGSANALAEASIVNGATVEFATTAPLAPGEGLTVAVGFPKGLVTEPGIRQRLIWFVGDNKAALAMGIGLLVALAWYLWAWNSVGRDPRKGVIIPRFEPPDGMSPAGCRYVSDMSLHREAFTAAVISLGVKGWLEIVESGEDYALRRRRDPGPVAPSAGERAVLEALLPGPESSIELEHENHREFRAAQKGLEKALSGEYRGRLFRLNAIYALPAMFASAAAGVAAIPMHAGPALWISYVVLSIVLHVVFVLLLRAPTLSGRRVLDEIEGFRMYLDTAEQERLERMRSPALTPEVFEAFLPYAFALGVENSWCARFANEFPYLRDEGSGYRPAWYIGGRRGAGALGRIGSGLGGGLSSAIAAASSPPGSSSGSGGGGFSGGGGGGGGGGGW